MTTESQSDARRIKYLIDSQNLMYCPHVAGSSTYIKTFHPEWSSSTIQSAIMTTIGLRQLECVAKQRLRRSYLKPEGPVLIKMVTDEKKALTVMVNVQEQELMVFMDSRGYTSEKHDKLEKMKLRHDYHILCHSNLIGTATADSPCIPFSHTYILCLWLCLRCCRDGDFEKISKFIEVERTDKLTA
ncbi:hypothetical protein Bca52824_025900 [Brassica carinata]|uniref:Uncharacterized protein n=1 Tax=Brassica carinata TaxID=52824 RepID=A0A8X7V8M3_BRACI|nr:hypothetical protein Bca52824_025900 [Brassica carinata]